MSEQWRDHPDEPGWWRLERLRREASRLAQLQAKERGLLLPKRCKMRFVGGAEDGMALMEVDLDRTRSLRLRIPIEHSMVESILNAARRDPG